VKNVKASTYLQNLWDEHKENEDLKTLPYQDIIDKAEACFNGLQTVADQVKALGLPCMVKDQEAKVSKAVEKYQAARQQLDEYVEHINEVIQRTVANTSNQKKSWRNAREYIKGLLLKTTVPKAVARNAATAMQAMIADPNEIGIPHTYFTLDLVPSKMDKYSGLDQPALLAKNHWKDAIDNYVLSDRVAIDGQITTIIDHLTAVKRSHAIGTVAATTEFPWKPDGCEAFDISGSYTKHIIAAMEQGKFDVSAAAAPYLGTSMFINSLKGHVYVAALSPSFVEKAGGDMELYMQNADSMVLDEGVVSFVLSPGQSCWVPFGWFACLLGMAGPSDIELIKKRNNAKRNQDTTVKFSAVSLLVCPNKKDATASKGVVNRFLSDQMRASANWPNSLTKSAGFLEWKAELEKANS